MEILEASRQLTELAWWQAIAIAACAMGLLTFIIGITTDTEFFPVFGVIAMIVAFIVFVSAPWWTPTDEYITTIEITDSSKYEELVNSGYSFKRIYDNRNIYEITGDEIK